MREGGRISRKSKQRPPKVKIRKGVRGVTGGLTHCTGQACAQILLAPRRVALLLGAALQRPVRRALGICLAKWAEGAVASHVKSHRKSRGESHIESRGGAIFERATSGEGCERLKPAGQLQNFETRSFASLCPQKADAIVKEMCYLLILYAPTLK